MAIWLVRASSHGEYEHKLDKHRLYLPAMEGLHAFFTTKHLE